MMMMLPQTQSIWWWRVSVTRAKVSLVGATGGTAGHQTSNMMISTMMMIMMAMMILMTMMVVTEVSFVAIAQI